MTQLDNIKSLYDKIEDKESLRNTVADYFNIKASTVRTTWFYRWEFPDKYRVQENLITIMQNVIMKQNKSKP